MPGEWEDYNEWDDDSDGWEDYDIDDIDETPGVTGADEEAWYEDFGEGVVASGLGTYYGVKDLFGGVTPEERANLEDWKSDAAQSGWGAGGKIAGELAQLALPGAAALKGVRALGLANKAAQSGKAANFALRGLDNTLKLGAEMGAAGSLAALKLPGEDETRIENAKQDAGSAALGFGLGKVLSEGVLPKGKDALELINNKVRLSPAQSTSNVPFVGPMTDMFETLSELVPVIGASARHSRQRGVDDWGKYILREATPPKFRNEITKTGSEGYIQVKSAFDKAYAEAWGKIKKIPPGAISELTTLGNRYANLLPAHEATLKRIVRTVNKSKRNPAIRARTIDKAIGNALTTAYKNPGKNGDLISALDEMRVLYREMLPKGVNKALAKVDKHYPKRLAVRDAVGKSDLDEGVFTPNKLIKSSGQVGGKEAKATGLGPLGPQARAGQRVIDTSNPPELFNYWRKLTAEKSPRVLPLTTLGDIATGQTGLQRAVQSEKMKTLFDLVNMSRYSAATQED